MHKLLSIAIIIAIVQLTPLAALAYGDNFSCPMGKQGACLDYNDKVCSFMSKCVSNDAVCFDSYTCNYKGFICKSKFDDVVEEHEDVANKYNQLLRSYEVLTSCVSYASSLDEAQACY